MVSEKELLRQIGIEEKKIKKAEESFQQRLKLRKLKKKLGLLKSPTKRTFSNLSKRFGKGFKEISKKGGAAIIRQAQLIKAQQQRENALAKKSQKNLGKKMKKTKRSISEGVFGDLDF